MTNEASTNGSGALELGLSPSGPGYSRAEEVSKLLSTVQDLVRPFIEAADADANALPSGHGLRVEGGAPRTVLVERHPPSKLASLLDLSTNVANRGAEDFRAAVSSILQYSVNTSSPGFMDKLYSAPSPPALAGDLLLSSLNTNTHVYNVSPALTLVEKHVGRELAALFGVGDPAIPSQAGGISVPGGAAANTTAMLVARNVRFPRVKEVGVAEGLPRPLAVFASEAAHYSAVTAAQMLGLGSKAVHKVATLADDRMDPAALEREMAAAERAGELPFFVCGTAGTTVRGAYDDLRALGELSRRHGAWFHIDACWGGGAIFSPKLRHKLAGSELADSVAFNPHKMLGVTVTCSFLLARDMRMLLVANKLEAGYLFHGDAEEANVNGVDAAKDTAAAAVNTPYADKDGLNMDWRNSPWIKASPGADTVFDHAQFVPQCGRRPEALKLYMHWRYYGTEGIGRHVEAMFAGARTVMQLVRDSPVLRCIGGDEAWEPPCAQACFYYCGDGGRLGIDKSVTRAIAAKLAHRGWMTDFAPGKTKDEEYIRAVCNRLTTGPVAEGLVKAVCEAGREVEKELGL